MNRRHFLFAAAAAVVAPPTPAAATTWGPSWVSNWQDQPTTRPGHLMFPAGAEFYLFRPHAPYEHEIFPPSPRIPLARVVDRRDQFES